MACGDRAAENKLFVLPPSPFPPFLFPAIDEGQDQLHVSCLSQLQPACDTQPTPPYLFYPKAFFHAGRGQEFEKVHFPERELWGSQLVDEPSELPRTFWLYKPRVEPTVSTHWPNYGGVKSCLAAPRRGTRRQPRPTSKACVEVACQRPISPKRKRPSYFPGGGPDMVTQVPLNFGLSRPQIDVSGPVKKKAATDPARTNLLFAQEKLSAADVFRDFPASSADAHLKTALSPKQELDAPVIYGHESGSCACASVRGSPQKVALELNHQT